MPGNLRRTRFLKVLLLALLPLLLLQNANATLYFTDHFDYTDGANLGSATGGGGATWTLSSGDVSQIKVSAASTQASPGNFATASGLGVAVTPTGSRKQTGVPFNGTTGIPVADGNVVYASFLLNVQTLPSANLRVAYMHSAASTQGGIEVVVSSTGQVGIQKKGSGTTFASGTPVASPGTHLVVMRYTFQSGNDQVAVWVDPDSSRYGVNPAPTTGAFAATTGGGSDMSVALTYFIIESAAVTGPVFWIDEVRVGTTWAEVTPTDGSLPPATVPVITEARLAPEGMILRGTNGPADSPYQVLASTSLALPLTNWPVIGTHPFDSEGHFDSTNPVAPGLGQQFFRLLVGGTIPPGPTAPAITNQPLSQVVAVGGTVSLLVGATGTTPLDYYWVFNTNTPVGGNSNRLDLTGVQTNDAGGYQVVVSNSVGSVTSAVAALTVLVPPAITGNPTNLTVSAGNNAVFSVMATGSEPLHYQWYFNTNSALAGATDVTLTLNSVNATNAGAYSVVVTNLVGSATSSAATLTVLGPPFITTQPQSQTVAVSNNATFSVAAIGTGTLGYQWFFNTNTPVGVNSNRLTLLNVQTNDAGGYSVVVNNSYGATTSLVATLTVNPPITNNAIYNLYGFGEATTGGGIVAEGSAGWVKVTNALDFAWAISNKSGTIKVIEIMNDLDLGWNEIGAAVQGFSIFREHNPPQLHPRLLQTGVSKVDIQNKNGLTIFSANGATIRHITFNIKSSQNIIIRNLKFDEMWEWDEASKGDYDENDWDFITLGDGGGTVSDVWIDHCTFSKAYDGICDIKGGANHITFSWNKYMGDDGATNPNSFVWQQINSLESNKTSYAMYNFLRTHGFSTTNIVTIIQGHDKTHLIGVSPDDYAITFHHQWYINPWDRLPRLRGGNVHNYNIYVDDTLGLAAKRLRNSIVDAMSPTDQIVLNGSATKDPTYKFNPFLNGTISTEGGAILVEKSVYIDCLTPLRNNQTDPSDPSYTGKIMALDSIYHFDNADATTVDYRGDSTNAPGTTLFGPIQAPVIPFSWNGFTTLPYSYVMDDPSQLEAIVTSPTSGAGAGVLTWDKTNWLKTTY